MASELGVGLAADLRPDEKVAALARLPQPAALAGDGINDGPALAAAPVGIAVGGATALARGIADVVLLHEDLRLIPFAIALARRTVGRGWRALFAATAYNLLFVTLAAAGVLRPVWAGLSMLLASLLVLASVVGITSARPSAARPVLDTERVRA
jgi:P-type E1-E2 ATPase